MNIVEKHFTGLQFLHTFAYSVRLLMPSKKPFLVPPDEDRFRKGKKLPYQIEKRNMKIYVYDDAIV